MRFPRERRGWPDLTLILGLASAMALVVVFAIRPSLAGTPLRLAVVNDLLAGRSIAYTPYPVGYPLFAALSMKAMGMRGLAMAQAVLYVATVLFAWLTLNGFGARRRLCAVGAIAIALYPNLLFAITRFVDTVPSCFLLAAFAWLLMRLRRDGLSLANALTSGVLFGLTLMTRPNGITLAPIALWAAFAGRKTGGREIGRAGLAAAVSIAILAAAIVPLKGRLVVFDRYYGAYTFANGTHEHAAEGILRDYNGEMTMPESVREMGLPFYGLERNDPAIADEYIEIGRKFIHDHPARYAALEGLKIANLFRPDYRNVNNSVVPKVAAHAMHTLIAALVPAWLALRLVARKKYRAQDGLILIPLLILFLAPFVATNTDPRYRIPADILIILDSVLCVAATSSAAETPMKPAAQLAVRTA
jgi:hypothetical protein